MYRLLHRITIILWWAAVASSAVFAVLIISAKQLIPYLDSYRPQIENNLMQITGYPVQLQSIDGNLEGIDPTISVLGLSLKANGHPSVEIAEMRVRIDTVKSILSLSPKFTYVRFVSPSVSLQENGGQWRLMGAAPSKDVTTDVGVERVLDYLLALKQFSILNADINIESETYGKHSIKVPDTYLFHRLSESLLTSTFYLDDIETPFKVSSVFDKSSNLFGDYRVKSSFNTPEFSLPLSSSYGSEISGIKLGGDFWLDFIVGKELKVQMESSIIKVAFNNGEEYSATPSVKLRYSMNNPSLHVQLQGLAINDGSQKYPDLDASFSWSSVADRSVINFDQMDLGLANRISSHFLETDWVASKILTGLSPSGMATNGSVRLWRENDHISFQYLSNLESASVNAYNGIPAVSELNAIFSLSENEGYIVFNGGEGELFFDTVYDDSWVVQSFSGRVDWSKQNDIFLVEGKDLSVERNGADINGDFRLEIRESSPDWILLDLHGNNISVQDRLTYIPKGVLGDDLKGWIKTAFFGDGMISDADILIHTDLTGTPVPRVRMQMNVVDADVRFDSNWPEANKVNGFFEYNDGVIVNINSASISGLSISDLLITVPIINGSADFLNLKGTISDESSDIFQLLKSSPLKGGVLKPFESWDIAGGITSAFEIAIPLSNSTSPKININIDFKNNDLYLSDLDIPVYVNRGTLNYSDNGIQDSSFSVNAFGGETDLVLSSIPSGEGLAILGNLNGNVDLNEIARWHHKDSDPGIIDRVNGHVEYQGNLSINQSQDGQFNLTLASNLKGGEINLPKPFGKEKNDTKPFSIEIRKHGLDVVINQDYNALVRARVLLTDEVLVGGEILLNDAQSFSAQIPKGLVIKGVLPLIDINEWMDVISDSPDNASSETLNLLPKIPDWLNRVDLIFDELLINQANTLHNLKINYDKGQPVSASSDELSFVYKNNISGPDLHFNFLSWNTLKAKEIEPLQLRPEEPLIHANQIPNMTLSFDQIYINEQPFGDWKISIVTEGNLVKLAPITTSLKTGTFNGSLAWLDDGDLSKVELNLGANGKELAELTRKFSNDSFVTSDQYKMDVNLKWKGSPFYFDRESVSGSINFGSKDGNFSKIDELPPFLKVLGMFNIGSLSRRLTLDFSDVYTPGLSYDEFKGNIAVKNGLLNTVSPISLISPSAEISVEGSADIVNETLSQVMTASFPISGTLPLAGLLLSTPQIAGLLYITDKLIGDQISKVTSVQYDVKGSFENPTMTPVRFKSTDGK